MKKIQEKCISINIGENTKGEKYKCIGKITQPRISHDERQETGKQNNTPYYLSPYKLADKGNISQGEQKKPDYKSTLTLTGSSHWSAWR